MILTGHWQQFTSPQLRGLDPERSVAVLPVSAIEQHGPHLPLATDALVCAALVEAALEHAPPGVLALPPMSIGHSLEHVDFAGTLSIGAETLLASWTDIGKSVARSGVRKLVLLNTHGGNTALVQLAALRLRHEADMLVVRANYFHLGSPPGLFSQDELAHGLHGGEMETSLLLHLAPELVRREALADFPALTHAMAQRQGLLGPEKPIGFGWKSQDLHEQGVCGNAARADAQRGAALFQHLVARLCALLKEVRDTPLSILRERSPLD